ncbi:hypothetical protein EYZ11_011584 [Aspergillus tanneri]|uniref:F-box domain-containing protein n=1 Tax=Aspergillus tanneri TaxID=1220188 RepID=A0A4S3J2G0_9EURO|nr:uncharacterized protein ATNIH1004_011460 [Aspergillus tanneri]KAA8642515.1 hypothetical protein ATNIH1004_011460 [Aspergillus tanneri]THC88969.1 hypothetical protein EYZ11_011584 [Aspergillus tanneri]
MPSRVCRAPGEPDWAKWDYTGCQPDLDIDEIDLDYCSQNGCGVVVRYPKEENDVIRDADYVPREEDTVPYEYGSDHESMDAVSLGEDSGPNDEGDGKRAEEEDQWYRDWLLSSGNPQSLLPGEPAWTPPVHRDRRNEVIFPLTSGQLPEGYSIEQLEHLAGPTCADAHAYSGHRISMEAMRGCRTAQFLVHKEASEADWQPDGLDEDWELSGDWFLSGLSDGTGSRDTEPADVSPPRGGLDQIDADNINFDPQDMDSDSIAMPFHPWCFDIFCRLSKVRFNHVNVSGLMKWRNTEFSSDDFDAFPRNRDVLEAQQQWWCHNHGHEYLVANPLYVPNLDSLLLATVHEEEDHFSPHIGAFDLSRRVKHTEILTDQARPADFLASLPLELRLYIVGFLGSRDIANLRLASRTFEQLPVGLWYRLVRDEMPWLWEAWDETECAHVPSIWTTVTATDVQLFVKKRQHYASVLSDEYQGGNIEDYLDLLVPMPMTTPRQLILPRARTNWYQVYTQIKRNWSQLKGLQNRQRIWTDVEEIIARIIKYSYTVD